MPTTNFGWYTPSNTADSFGSTFLPGLVDTFEAIDGKISELQENTKGFPYSLANTSAVGDGTNDDTAILQWALDNFGGFLGVKGKTYRITAPLTGNVAHIQLNGAKIEADFAGDAMLFEGNLVLSTTASSAYQKGSYSIECTSVAGVEIGQVIRVANTTDLYNTERNYYFKGGVATVTSISGNTVYMSMAFPFDIQLADTGIYFYDPADVLINGGDGMVQNPQALPAGSNGIKVVSAKGALIKNVKTDNFVINIQVKHSVDSMVSHCHVNRSNYVGTGSSYGIINNSCTNLTIRNCFGRSGRHTIAHGGNEPVYNSYLFQNAISAEDTSTNDLDAHGNVFSLTVEQCVMDGFSVAGNVHFKNCVIQGDHGNTNRLGVAENYTRASYKFDGCRFLGGDARIELYGWYNDNPTLTRKWIHNITFDDCTINNKMILKLKLNDTGPSSVMGEIYKVTIRNTDDLYCYLHDHVQDYSNENSKLNYQNPMLFVYASAGGTDNAVFTNCGIPNTYQGLYIADVERLSFYSCYTTDVGATNGRPQINMSGTGQVNFFGCDFSAFHNGIDLDCNKLVNIGSWINWYGTPLFTEKKEL